MNLKWTVCACVALMQISLPSVICGESREKRAPDFDSVAYLEQFGYLDKKKAGAQHDETSRKNAISEFQVMAGLEVTGEMNKVTLDMMLAPRCGLPDVIRPSDRINPSSRRLTSSNRNQPLEFNAPGYKWEKTSITYKFVGWSRQLSQASQRRAIRQAFEKWSTVAPLTFREVSSGSADILLNFVWRDHRDGSPFDGRGGTLAHAFFPGDDIGGDTHFDEEEQWTENTADGTNLEIVAAHEFGHALGLGHSNVPGALMLPFYKYDARYKLGSDDISGIQSLYGARRSPIPRTTRRPRVTTRRPRVTTRRPRVTTRRPNPRPTQKTPVDEDVCEMKFDDIANGPDGALYAFRYRKIYKFNSNGVGIERRFPRNVRKVFPRAPNNIGAAVYDRRYRKFYIFKGVKIWRYSGFTLDAGYPKRLKGWYRGIQAALAEDNGEMRVLKGKEMSVWREDFELPPRGYPIRIQQAWPGLRGDLEAAVRYRRVSYFFKGANYFKYNDYYRKVDYRKAKAGPWLGCGRVEPK